MLDVKGRWVFITGAARGIGRGAALFMASKGCNLILQARKAENCAKTAEEARALGVEVRTVGAEFSDLKQVEAMLAAIDDMKVDVDIVLNNAGLQIAYREKYNETPASDYETSFTVNTTAPMMIVYHFLPKMEKRAFGRIVNTTSGIRLEPEQAGYSASKAALDKVTMDLASKYNGTDICINLTDPGWCRTDLGGPNAPNSPESSLPGVVTGAFINDRKSGRLFAAGDFYGMTIEEAVEKAEKDIPYYTGSIGF
ncbi:SDR family oxidoreductase [Ruminococcus sp. HUN007]|uniref:SDR family NAD(P)-dependent oxidoreductase n=1 Tax=Ruminococcus sp. HUN007 TaxID=1514668 RepID=UPI0005D27EF1|nr:SDR family oxidoreductase [Ruminococcus sp. HUN007]